MSRRLAREYTMKLLYQTEITGEQINSQSINEFIEEYVVEKCDTEYIKDVAIGVIENISVIDAKINTYSSGWNINRLSKIDLSVLRIAIYEMLFKKDIPTGVSINEAVELSKQYSTDDAPAFVNGVLGNLFRKEIEKSNE